MLTFDFNRKAHTTIFPELYFCTQYFFCCILTSNRRQFDVKLKSTLNRFSFLSSYRRFKPLQRNKQHDNATNLGVYSTSRYKLFALCENTVRHFVTSL